MSKKQELTVEQKKASNPNLNVWVQANAGTGKTTVLVQRLLNILFRDPDLSSGILCLTFTNAAASEMRNRILDALRKWAMADDDNLRELLVDISNNSPPTDEDLARAREIFFTYIDNPDILKIKTIHGFCEEILRRFPMEAGISPSWKLISDADQRRLLRDTFE
ncbi:MAG: UvrD-helicase domain-containing protein, partial [Alphaproteobacteria bacterium]|nr:UvrD-helicase domain-containing protein [Alphaproteobacteria bacterium]